MQNYPLFCNLFPNSPKRSQRKEITREIKKVDATVGPSTHEELCVKGVTYGASEISFIFPGDICEKFPATKELYEKLKADSGGNVRLTLRETHTIIYTRDRFGNEHVAKNHTSLKILEVFVF